MIRNYNSSLLRPHGKPIFLCFIEFSEAYCNIFIKPYLLFLNGDLLVNSAASPPFDITKCGPQAALDEFVVLLWVKVGQPWSRRFDRPRDRLAVLYKRKMSRSVVT
jgi:hypothetical protein